MGNDAQTDLLKELGRQVGTKISGGHLTLGCPFDRKPPLRRDVALAIQPVPDQSLAGVAPVIAVGTHLVGQGLLPASNLDGSLKGSNVRLFHRPQYTTTVVKSNTHGCMTSNNTGCNVSEVDFRTRKVTNTAKKPKAEQSARAIVGHDGKTLGQRLHEAIAYHEGVIQRKYTAQDLFRDVNRLLGAPEDSPAVTQQSISKILIPDSKVTTSKNCVYFAQVLGVDCLWMSSGMGSKIPKR